MKKIRSGKRKMISFMGIALVITMCFGTTIPTFAKENETMSLETLEQKNANISSEYTGSKNSLIASEPIEKKLVAQISTKNRANATKVSSANGFYKALRKQLLARKKTFTILYDNSSYKKLPSAPLDMVWNASKLDDKNTSDDADFMYGSLVNIGYSSIYNQSECAYTFSVHYTETKSQVNQLNKKIKSVLKSKKVAKMSDVAKVKVIHDYIVNLVSYDQSMVDHSAYGGLIADKHTTVCQGYSLLMYKMLTDAGIDARYITGYANEAHAWNAVKINKKWYYIDATWDDPIAKTPVLSYNYFLIGSNTLNKDHKVDAIYQNSFKAQAGNFDWQSAIENSNKKADKNIDIAQTKEEQKESEDALNRNIFAKTLCEGFDETLNYEESTIYEKRLYDLYKKIYTAIICEMSDDSFERLSYDDVFFEKILTDTDKCIQEKILQPCLSYMDSDNILEDIATIMHEDYEEEALESMSDEELEQLVDVYMELAFDKCFSDYSTEYTDSIVETILETIE